MSATPYLDDLDVDSKTKRVLAGALEKTRVSLALADNFADGIDSSNLPGIFQSGKALQGEVSSLRR